MQKITPAELPDFVYLVTEERVRQGKRPLKFQPSGYDHSGRFILAPNTPIDCVSQLFCLEDCYMSPQSAMQAVQSIVQAITQREQAKLERLKARLSKTLEATRQMVSDQGE